MYTIMMVELPENKGRMISDYQLCRGNWYIAPHGVIRIARFESSFDPKNNRGYYGDIYFKRFIRKWKKWTLELKQRRIDHFILYLVSNRLNIIEDIHKNIMEFL
ncbi:MAG: hypothetical protein EBS06_07995 [Proteobacteria bacterium]|nr:hypothetical protein [Pseudomonadota bacterium]